MRERPISFHPRAIREFAGLPDRVRERAAYQLDRIRHGRRPTDWKPIKGAASDVIEIRIRDGRAFRIVCATGFGDAIHVLHVFEKKSMKMPRRNLELVRRRYAQVKNERTARGNDHEDGQ
jgi:phage-related protein